MKPSELNDMSNEMGLRVTADVLHCKIDVLTWLDAESRIMRWARARQSKRVSICNVHSVVTAVSDLELRRAINESDMATPDGMPVAWLIANTNHIKQERINGPDLVVRLCRLCEIEGVSIGFYGSSPETLERLNLVLRDRFPRLEIACMIAPPMIADPTVPVEKDLRGLSESGAQIIFIGLGCPKQEKWMRAQALHLNAVSIGVGAAFDYIAGNIKRPPRWMQNSGLEWLGRLLSEPRRLWRRYLVTNSLYLMYVLMRKCGMTLPNSSEEGKTL